MVFKPTCAALGIAASLAACTGLVSENDPGMGPDPVPDMTPTPTDPTGPTVISIEGPQPVTPAIDAGSSARPDAGPSGGACLAPRHYVFSRPDTVPIPCGTIPAPYLKIFDETLTDTGYALARVSATISNPSTDAYEPYYDLAVSVGNGFIPFTTGQDLCPGVTLSPRVQLGYGLLGTMSSVTVFATQGAASCIDGRVTMSNLTLDVWVEDPSPGCRGKDVQLVSTFGDANAVDMSLHLVSTSPTPLLALAIPPSSDRSQLLLMGAVELSPHSLGYVTPYSCTQAPTLSVSSQLTMGATVIASDEDGAQAFQSMGHVTLGPSATLTWDGTAKTLALSGQSGFPVSIPVEVGGPAGGDAKLGFVKQ